MTDVLTRLEVLTDNEPEGTTPRPWHVGAQNPMTGELNIYRQFRDPSFTTTSGIGIRVVATLGNRFRRELDDEARANAELIAATMNREAALIALVQEAAGEIERLRGLLGLIRMKAEWRFQASDFVSEEDPAYGKVSDAAIAATAYLREVLAMANKALQPQKAGND